MQAYIESRPKRSHSELSEDRQITSTRKRKSPESDLVIPKEFTSTSTSGLLTPQNSTSHSPSHSVTSLSSSPELEEPHVYNGVLSYREGNILAKSSGYGQKAAIDARTLPSTAMLQEALLTPVPYTEKLIWQTFSEKLKSLPGVDLENNVDRTTPSLNFTFLTDYAFGEGVTPAAWETRVGCEKCKPDMGQNIGCEYTRLCGCLEYAAVDEAALERKDPVEFEEYKIAKSTNGEMKTSWPKRFPYSKPTPGRPQTLAKHYRETRNPIYECNDNCRCGPRCKSRLVQKGRQVPLTIFKTSNGRGWGVKSSEELIQGEFIDTYVGEVITDEEAKRRGDDAGPIKESYLYSLDKFVGDPFEGTSLEPEDCYVVDGQYMGGPTRFINHSCEPNCRQYTVSYNKYDLRLFTLAFFAYEDIPAGTELTFDYMDQDEEEEEDAVKRRMEMMNDPENHDKVKCKCGARKCRGILWS